MLACDICYYRSLEINDWLIDRYISYVWLIKFLLLWKSRSPDDPFDRFWQPFGPNNPVAGVPNVSVSGFWNLPPAKIFETRLTADTGALELQWPQGPLQSSMYYIALYFADDSVSASGRSFSISINDVQYFSNLSVTSPGVAVFATQWPLAGLTNIKFTPVAGSDAGPLINGGEVFRILMLGRRTLVRDGTVFFPLFVHYLCTEGLIVDLLT